MASVTFCLAEEKKVPLAVFVLHVGLFVDLGRKLHTGHYNSQHDIKPNDIPNNELHMDGGAWHLAKSLS